MKLQHTYSVYPLHNLYFVKEVKKISQKSTFQDYFCLFPE